MDPVNIWLYHNRLKKVFTKKNNITPSLPVMEFLLAGDTAKGDGVAFSVKQAGAILKSANAEKTERTLYATAKYCRDNGLIKSVTPGRQYYQPYHYILTVNGSLLVQKFKHLLNY